MFGFEYFLAYIKYFTQLGFAIVGAIPFYYSWNCIAPKYLATWVPVLYQKLPFWHIVAIFICCSMIGENIQKLIPAIVKINQNVTTNEKKG